MILTGRLLNDPDRRPESGWIRLEGGCIADLGRGGPPGAADLGGEDCIICPGFIDAHTHLPQIQVIGYDGLELMEWLQRVIYPVEARWSDPAVARAQIALAYARMLRSGTLGFAGFLTSHEHGPPCLLETERPALRAHVGQSLIDREAPANMTGHRRFPVDSPAGDRTWWSMNPRFAVCCSDEMLAEAGRNRPPGAFIQTHLAESRAECRRVAELFAGDPHYTGVYDRHGLLTEHTLLAHCLHLSDAEWELIARRRSVVVHCPTANTFLRSGLFDLDAACRHGVRLALGSDVAAGPDVAMPQVARAMIEVAKMRAMTGASEAHIPTPAEVWRLITRGNAEALGWMDAGRLERGAAADLLVLRPPMDADEHLIGRLLYTWRDEYILARIVAGALVDPAGAESLTD